MTKLSLYYKYGDKAFTSNMSLFLNLLYSGGLEPLGYRMDENDPDVCLVLGSAARVHPEVLDSDKPVIILQRRDSTTHGEARRFLEHDNVVGFLPPQTISPKCLHNGDVFADRYHANLIRLASDGEIEGESYRQECLPEQALAKIHPMYTPSAFPNYHFAAYAPVWSSKRDIDVHFVGTMTNPRAPWYEYHRQQCREAIESLVGVRSFAPLGRCPNPTYMEKMCRSKIVVSPWGLGEICHRDFEAIAAGCILVKPDSDHVDTWPPLFAEKRYVKCAIDFSDLDEVVNGILADDSKRVELVQSNAAWLTSHWCNDVFAKRIASVFDEVLE